MNTRLSEYNLLRDPDPEMRPYLRWVFKNNVQSGEKIAKLKQTYQGLEWYIAGKGKRVTVTAWFEDDEVIEDEEVVEVELCELEAAE
jgi:hypothetical protein